MMTNPHIFGMPIVVDTNLRDRPRFTLSEKVMVTQEFRDEFNAWARDFFGTDAPIIKLIDPQGDDMLLTNERGLRAIARAALK